MKTRSHTSCSSRQSKSSSASKAAAAQARAEAEAAKTEAAFAERENELKLQKAELEAYIQLQRTRLEVSLDRVRIEKKAAAAVAKAEVLEAAVFQDNDGVLSEINVPADDPKIRTKEYIQEVDNYTNTAVIHNVDAPTGNPEMANPQDTPTKASYHKIYTAGNKLSPQHSFRSPSVHSNAKPNHRGGYKGTSCVPSQA